MNKISKLKYNTVGTISYYIDTCNVNITLILKLLYIDIAKKDSTTQSLQYVRVRMRACMFKSCEIISRLYQPLLETASLNSYIISYHIYHSFVLAVLFIIFSFFLSPIFVTLTCLQYNIKYNNL